MKKICISCHKDKDIGEFRVYKNGHVHSWCRMCENERSKKYNREHWDVVYPKQREHRKKNSKKYNALSREWYKNHPEWEREWHRKYRETHKDAIKEYQRQYRDRARKKGITIGVT